MDHGHQGALSKAFFADYHMCLQGVFQHSPTTITQFSQQKNAPNLAKS
jgi:hypothetical protein